MTHITPLRARRCAGSLLIVIGLASLFSCARREWPQVEMPLIGTAAEIERFSGPWYDDDGRLLVSIGDGAQPRLSLWQNGGNPILKAARARIEKGEVRIDFWSEYEIQPARHTARLRPTIGQRAELFQDNSAPTDDSCSTCGCSCAIWFTTVNHAPSPAWFGRLAAHRAASAAADLRNVLMDIVARWL